MSMEHIHAYHRQIEKLRARSGSDNESSLRPAFQQCLIKYGAKHDLVLVEELPYKDTRKIPDGTVKDAMRLDRGYWEAKDSKDDIDEEIDKKLGDGYPTSNIIFENSCTAVLLQNGDEVQRVNMGDAQNLHKLISEFFAYEPPIIAEFSKATQKFRDDLPDILVALRDMIDKSIENNLAFRTAVDNFLSLCRKTINPEVEVADVREMLIQHILTKDIFLKVFGEDQFHKENNIAQRLDDLENTFFTGNFKRNMVDRLKVYYSAITAAAASIGSHHEKQQFLKAIYQDFYTIYNPKAADRLGVVYTPNEIVGFMIKATDHLVKKYFGRHLYNKHVHILDPAAGTGTFITDLIDFMPTANLPYKYQHEINANEVSILPYYIANLNIEYTYKQKIGEYVEFRNICFVDTLDNLYFRKSKTQGNLRDFISHENLERIKRQNEKDISVIIGNPPYNANQRNENDNNKNREYVGIDARIKETYVKQSIAQKTKQYDMYKRFIRWATDRLGDLGVLAFITNRSWIDSKQDDGFRKIAAEEFSKIYIVDLGGDIRATSGAGNVFGIMTGVAIGFFVRKTPHDEGCDIHYMKCGDFESAENKLAFLDTTAFRDIDFEHIVPNEEGRWIDQIDNDFGEFTSVADKSTKFAKSAAKETSIFKLYSLGVVTARDDWVYDFDKRKLHKKVKFFLSVYKEMRAKFGGKKVNAEKLGQTIKWSRYLKKQLADGEINAFDSKVTRLSLFRPYVEKYIYFDKKLNEMQYLMPKIFPTGKNKENKVICFSGLASAKPFQALAVGQLYGIDFLEKTQCLPLYRYDTDGVRDTNITAYGLDKFRVHYSDKNISAEDIFHYTYAVLHNPAYREKYAINLTREFPRLPFYDDFAKWVAWGEELMATHIGFATAAPAAFQRRDIACRPGHAKLRADKTRGTIIIDEQTELLDIPPLAWQYQLGSRSALEWVLDQYKEKTPRYSTIKEKFNTYRFADHKEDVIDLLAKVCAVSIKTIEIIEDMRQHNPTPHPKNPSPNPCN